MVPFLLMLENPPYAPPTTRICVCSQSVDMIWFSTYHFPSHFIFSLLKSKPCITYCTFEAVRIPSLLDDGSSFQLLHETGFSESTFSNDPNLPEYFLKSSSAQITPPIMFARVNSKP